MKRVMVRYKVKADRAEENQQLIENVFEALQAASPSGIRYASFKLEDGVSFVHVAPIETDDGSNPLAELDAFDKFTEAIQDRCEEPPVVTPITEIGSYRFFGQEV